MKLTENTYASNSLTNNNFECEFPGNGNAKTLCFFQVQEPRASNYASLGALQHRQIDVLLLYLGRKER